MVWNEKFCIEVDCRDGEFLIEEFNLRDKAFICGIWGDKKGLNISVLLQNKFEVVMNFRRYLVP